MVKKKGKSTNKPKDRFEEIKEELVHHMGMLHEQTKYDMSLIAEQVAHNSQQISTLSEQMAYNTEQISKLYELVNMMRYDLKLKADNLEMIALSRRVTMLERKVIGKR